MTEQTTTTEKPIFWAAPDLAKMGYPVFPVNEAKAPSVAGGLYAGTTDVSKIAQWITEGKENHDIGFTTGHPSLVVVIDADTAETCAEMEAKYGEPDVRTKRGGHWYFKHPQDGKVFSRNIRPGLDCKGDGGFVVVPPSRNRTWTKGIPDRAALPPMPEEFRELTRGHTTSATTDAPSTDKDVCRKAAEVIARRVSGIEEGGRHEHLKHTCGVLLSRGVSAADTETILVDAWTRVGGDLAERAPREVANTIRTTEAAIAGEYATGVPSMEEITPGLYEELKRVFPWEATFTVNGHRKQKTAPSASNDSDFVPPSPFTRVDLAPALKDGVDPPETLVPGILLKGKVHSIYSAGGTGKTFKMLYLVKRVVEQGLPVVIFDMENGLRIIAERLEVLGVTPEQSELIHYYPFPHMPIDRDVIAAYEEILDNTEPALVVFDSWINCLAACGLDENSSVDIARWADAYSQRARQREIASLILDHVPKEGNTARGSGRKLDYVDVQWELRNPQPFNRNTVGRIDLHLRKDREGWLPNTLIFAVGGGEEGFVFKPSAGLLLQANDEGLLPTDATVKEALESFGSTGARDKDWKEAAKARGVTARSTYYHARKNLLEKGHVEEIMGKYFIKEVQHPIGLNLDHNPDDRSNSHWTSETAYISGIHDGPTKSNLSPTPPLDQGQTGKSNGSNDPRSWTIGLPPDTPEEDACIHEVEGGCHLCQRNNQSRFYKGEDEAPAVGGWSRGLGAKLRRMQDERREKNE